MLCLFFAEVQLEIHAGGVSLCAMGTERCWAAQPTRFAPESGSGVPGLSACTSFYLQQPLEFHVRVIKLPLMKGETQKPGAGSLAGVGGKSFSQDGNTLGGLGRKKLAT